MEFLDRYCHFTNFLPNSLSTLRAQALVHGNAFSNHTSEKEKASAWIQPIQITKKVNFDNETLEMRGAFLIKAVATLEPKCLVQNEDRPEDGHSLHFGHELNSQVSETSKDYTTRVDEGETLRRKRISKANKGNVPWNKGRKHSAGEQQV
ncbi:hypothetical protein GIB67_041234 [Kingdonia uniflora]|uniref:Nuclease associated modular domain-containing protein n=1 Tax=Kingdonia uniflora TaxID=39325 RepID=A0A7J7MGW5_9MAGN|nr:hypothetical protein GIB67_041234 [Kingdonia uniflora]